MRAPGRLSVGDAIVVAIRPEHVALHPGEDATENSFTGVLDSASFVGHSMDCTVRIGDQPFKVLLHPEQTPPVGTSLTLYVAARHCLAMRATD